MKALVIILVVLLIITFAVIGCGFAVFKAAFGKRCNGDRRLKYLTCEDFEDLRCAPVSFKSDKGQILKGALYITAGTVKPHALVIFSHGMGGGHRSYMTEINTFAKNGFAVLAYDNTGTFASEGKSLVGFYQGVRDLKAAIQWANSNEKFDGLKKILVGHSWGGYSVCQNLADKDLGISGAVAFSAPDSGYQVVTGFLGEKMRFLTPLFKFIFSIADDKKSGTKCSDILGSLTSPPVLLLHGDSDTVVTPVNSPLSSAKVKTNPHITSIMYEGRFHNVYQTKESEEYLNNVFAGINALKKVKNPSKEEIDYCYDIDYDLITREDPAVMQTVINFIKNCI